jgi:RNA polymerase sigma-70 factor, ECF subfamily
MSAASLTFPAADWITAALAAGGETGAAPAPHAGDLVLAQRCAGGDPDAQRQFVERYTALVYSLCRRARLPPSDAEDVAQEVFCLAFAGLARYRGEAKLSGWLWVLTRRRIAEHLRTAARRPLPSGQPGDQGFPAAALSEPGPEADAIHHDRSARLRAAIDRLAEPAREVLVAYYLAETPVKEIARTLGLKEATVKTYLHRGRLALRQRLGGRP